MVDAALFAKMGKVEAWNRERQTVLAEARKMFMMEEWIVQRS
jgi:4-amino-4-deoxy-L-arabinose transferase-like glycosyltransferase